jgi:hypothetical protein
MAPMPAPYLTLLPEDVSGLFATFHANAPDVERFLKRFMVVVLTFRLNICSLYTLITNNLENSGSIKMVAH